MLLWRHLEISLRNVSLVAVAARRAPAILWTGARSIEPNRQTRGAVMQITRRNMLATGASAFAAAAAAPAFAAWEESTRYPDPRIQILDPSFARYRVAQSSVERLYTGARWGEGPVWMGDWRCLLRRDIP